MPVRICLLTVCCFGFFKLNFLKKFAGHTLSTPINKRIDIFFSLIGAALFIATGVLIIQEWEDAFIKNDTRKFALTKGALAIVNGVLFLLDALFTFRD